MKKWLILLCSLTLYLSAEANLKLPALVGDHMMLQRDKPIRIWGWADPEEQVTVLFQQREYRATADADGKWSVSLPALKAGGPYTMVLQGRNTITLEDILVGDVWVCGGQSNMERKMSLVKNAEQEIAAAVQPQVRLFKVNRNQSARPLEDVNGKWMTCTPENIRNYSAIAYFFARDILPHINTPIGLVDCSYGGTAIEAWISIPGMAGEPAFGEEAGRLYNYDLESAIKNSPRQFDDWIKTLDKADPAYADATYPWSKKHHPEWPEMQLPSIFEDAVPALDAKDGIIWFSKSFELRKDDLKDSVLLSLAIIDDDDLTFINGAVAGASRDARTVERKYTIPASLLKEGTNYITIRVIDYMNNGGIYGKKEQMYVQTGHRKIDLSGNWHYKMSLDTIFPVICNKEFSPKRKACLLYNAMVAPLTPLAIKGFLWYQGEANANKAYQYRSLFTRLIHDWRNNFRDTTLPFLFVQLANYRKPASIPREATWAELREAQAMALSLPFTAMVTAVDVGEADDIHPLNKQEVARRLALQARRMVYGEKNLATESPAYKTIIINGHKALLTFEHTYEGLKSKNGKPITGFQVSTDGKTFQYAPASIKSKNAVEINTATGTVIKAVRYAWADNPEPLNLENSSGLPALPFRTDTWNGLTYDARYDK